jgi:hypothetical protein
MDRMAGAHNILFGNTMSETRTREPDPEPLLAAVNFDYVTPN